MTTLLMVEGPDGRVHRCAASCHNARSLVSRCICGGVFTGIPDPSVDLRDAVTERMGALLTRFARRECAEDWRIVAWRESLEGPLLWRDQHHDVTGQLPLFSEMPASARGPDDA